MKTTALKNTALALLPATLLVLTGCWTPPTRISAPTGNPSLEGGMVTLETANYKATVESIDKVKRKVTLSLPNGTRATYKVGPQAVNFDQIEIGDKVTTVVAEERAIFVVKNGPLPSVGAGVLVAGAPEGTVPSGMLLYTADTTARVIGVDRSYRMLKVEFADKTNKTYKVPLPFTLANVQVGDDVVLRTTEWLMIRVKKG